MTQFVFCFPDRNIGGVPVLFGRLAQALAADARNRVSVIDYPDGAMTRNFASGPVRSIAYRDDRPVDVPPRAILINQTTRPWAMFPQLRIPDDVRMFFWNCHPFNLVPTLPGFRSAVTGDVRSGRVVVGTVLRPYRETMKRFTAFLLERKALAFMDLPNVRNTETYLGVSIPSPVFLPVCAADPLSRRPARASRDFRRDGLRLAWVGRLADFKHHILARALRDLDSIQPKVGVPLSFSIVGGGPFRIDVERVLSGLRHLDARLLGELPPNRIEPFLAQEVDLLFAMGASALEGLRMGIPTVLLDVAYAPVGEGYVYQWLHEREGFSLGDLITRQDLRPGNDSLGARLEEALTSYDRLSSAAAAHFAEHHACGKVAARLAALAQDSRCFYSDYKAAGFAKRDPLYEAFSYLREKLAG